MYEGSLNDSNSLPDAAFHPANDFNTGKYTMEESGLRVTARESKKWHFVKINDQSASTSFLWLSFHSDMEKQAVLIESTFPETWEGAYNWNHIVVRKDRMAPYFSKIAKVSRNTWSQTSLDPSLQKVDYEFIQIKPGPMHIVWIIRPGGPFPVLSFKDVGVEETGGVKFRIENFTYILFKMQHPVPSFPGLEIIENNTRYVLLKYTAEELDTCWAITNSRIKRWG